MKGKQKEKIRIKENATQLQPKSFKHLGKKMKQMKANNTSISGKNDKSKKQSHEILSS